MNKIWSTGLITAFMGLTTAAIAGSNQMPATQPSTQPVLDGKVLSTGTAMPATMPSGKSPIYTPAYGTADGGGNKASSVLLNGGIGPTVVPAGGNSGISTAPLPGIDESSKMRAPASQPTAR